MYTYIEVRKFEDDTLALRMDVTYRSERQRGKIIWGIEMNLNSESYYVEQVENEFELPQISIVPA